MGCGTHTSTVLLFVGAAFFHCSPISVMVDCQQVSWYQVTQSLFTWNELLQCYYMWPTARRIVYTRSYVTCALYPHAILLHIPPR